MDSKRTLRLFAGTSILVALALGVPDSPSFVAQALLWCIGFVGAGLLQSGLERPVRFENSPKRPGRQFR